MDMENTLIDEVPVRTNSFPLTLEWKVSGASRDEIEEAYSWERLLSVDLMSAHEVSMVPAEVKPSDLEVKLEEESQNLRKIYKIIRENDSDIDFGNEIPEIERLLPKIFHEMVGLEQTGPHAYIDPYDHTINVVRALRTDGLDDRERQIARVTAIFHDVGKVIDPTDRNHPRHSAVVTDGYLKRMGIEESMSKKILDHVRWHDALGDITRKDGRHIFNENDVLTFFPNKRDLILHKAIVVADVSSIPGLRKYLPNIEDKYIRLLEEHEKSPTRVVNEEKMDLPFEDFTEVDCRDIEKKLSEINSAESYDEIKLEDDLQTRKNRFLKLPEEDKKLIEEFIVWASVRNDGRLLQAMRATGRETDENYIQEIERRYGIGLENMRVASNLFSLTYDSWKVNYLIRNGMATLENRSQLVDRIRNIYRRSKHLGRYAVLGTHASPFPEASEIDSSNVLYQSRGGEHFEGDGIYCGVLGSYGEAWLEMTGHDISDGEVFEFIIELSNTVPIIADFSYPKAMVNYLGEMLDINEHRSGLATPHGLIQWRNEKTANYIPIKNADDWRVKLLSELLNNPPLSIWKDETGKEVVVADTDEDPIIWGSLCRAMCIRRFVPKKYVRYLDRSGIGESVGVTKSNRHGSELVEEIEESKEIRYTRIRNLYPRERDEDLM